MNNKEFIAELSRRMGLTLADTQKKVYNIVDAMNEVFTEGNTVGIPNFGVFEVRKKMERIIVSPSKGERMLVPPKLVLNFKPSALWKEEMKKNGEGE